MGHRINYIVVDNGRMNIHYHHWRAHSIPADLYLGEKTFLKFVDSCNTVPEILEDPWIEGCVVIDKQQKQLSFWPFPPPCETSVVTYYLNELSSKWPGWTINLLKREMLDVGKILGVACKIDTDIQYTYTKEEIISDKPEGWIETTIAIKSDTGLFVTKCGNLMPEGILSFGEGIIPLLTNKKSFDLPREGDGETYNCVVIDTVAKKVIANSNYYWTADELWPGYEVIVGEFGYLEALTLANIDTTGKAMTLEEVKKDFDVIVSSRNDFDPFSFAEKIKEGNEGKDIRFNSNFFDNPTP